MLGKDAKTNTKLEDGNAKETHIFVIASCKNSRTMYHEFS